MEDELLCFDCKHHPKEIDESPCIICKDQDMWEPKDKENVIIDKDYTLQGNFKDGWDLTFSNEVLGHCDTLHGAVVEIATHNKNQE